MMKKLILLFILLVGWSAHAQYPSGKYKTNFGEIDLFEYDNNVIRGKYYETNGKLIGKYYPSSKKIVGRFYNGKQKKWGHFQFLMKGTKIYGKWGWDSKMQSGSWNGSLLRQLKSKKTSSNTVTSSTKKPLKLKLTLTRLECIKNGDGGSNPDDYWLDFSATLKINGRPYQMKPKEYLKMKPIMDQIAPSPNLYINYQYYLSNGKSIKERGYLASANMNKRQLFARPGKDALINNSGVFTIPRKGVSESNTQFIVSARLEEQTGTNNEKDFAVMTNSENKKINLKRVLDYLTKKVNKNSFDVSRAPYYKMGTGYTSLTLDEAANGDRSVSGYFYGGSTKDNKVRSAKIHYTIELLDE
ncbi:hypothetical protein ACJD0Z_18350 [Flavobacteriaceae bacterium M23B6Z8]